MKARRRTHTYPQHLVLAAFLQLPANEELVEDVVGLKCGEVGGWVVEVETCVPYPGG